MSLTRWMSRPQPTVWEPCSITVIINDDASTMETASHARVERSRVVLQTNSDGRGAGYWLDRLLPFPHAE
jgi:hypothetical protein